MNMVRSVLRMETVTPYGTPFIFCDREVLPLWKGARFGYNAHFNPRIDEYWPEMGSLERMEYFFTFPGFEDNRTIPPGFFWVVPHQLVEYFCAFSPTEWGIWHERPIVDENSMLSLESCKEVRLEVEINISPKGAILFPAWMSGEDLVQYEFGIHKYTRKQEHADLIVFDLPPGKYAVDVLFPLDKHKNEDALGFMMSREM